MNLKHYHWWLCDCFLTCNKVQMWKIGSPRTSCRCFPSADMQKLRLTLFWTDRTRIWWGRHVLLWQRISTNTLYTQDTSLALACLHTFSLRANFLCWFTLQDTRHHENTMNNMKKMPNVWKHTWHLTTFPGQADKSMHLHFQRQPPHTQRHSRAKKGEIGQRLRLQSWPVNGCLYKPVALSHDISCTTHCCCPKVYNPTTPDPFLRGTEQKVEEARKEKREIWLGKKKHTGKGREVKNERERQEVEGLLIEEQLKSHIYTLLLLHNCVRTLTGVYVSWCFPAVFHRQTISHSKQRQKTFQLLPSHPPSHYPLCSAFTPTKKKKNPPHHQAT